MPRPENSRAAWAGRRRTTRVRDRRQRFSPALSGFTRIPCHAPDERTLSNRKTGARGRSSLKPISYPVPCGVRGTDTIIRKPHLLNSSPRSLAVGDTSSTHNRSSLSSLQAPKGYSRPQIEAPFFDLDNRLSLNIWTRYISPIRLRHSPTEAKFLRRASWNARSNNLHRRPYPNRRWKHGSIPQKRAMQLRKQQTKIPVGIPPA